MLMKLLHLLLRILYSAYFYLVFATAAWLLYWYGIVRGYTTHEQWRKLGLKLTDTLFAFMRIRISVRGRQNLPLGVAIYAANHQSLLEGFILFSILRTPFTAITAPFEIFPSVIPRWFKKMGYISTARDVFEELKYKNTHDHKSALAICIDTIKQGKSLLIFPEGTRERKKKILPFHTGVAHIAQATHVPIIPLVLHHVDDLFPSHSSLLSPTHISVEIEQPLFFPHSSNSDVNQNTHYLQSLIETHLPARYRTEKETPHYPEGKRAAFFDLDGTLTKRNIYQALIRRYLKNHFSPLEIARLIHLSFEKYFVKHGIFYQSAIRLLKDLDERVLFEDAREFIKDNTHTLFFKDMLDLLVLHKKERNLLFIVTEEPQEIADIVSGYLGIPIFGTHIEKRDHVFTGSILGHIMKEEWKREKIIELSLAHGIDLSKSYAYGNSWIDYAMLKVVGHPCLVRPSKSLAKRGRELDFRIITSLS